MARTDTGKTEARRPSPDETLILGAGPAGMACAMELSKAGVPCTIVERDSQVGGLAKTLVFQEGKLTFRTDIGPHRFFSKNRYLYDFIEDLLKERWIKVPRHTRQFIDGKFYDYPINATQAMRNIGIFGCVGMGFSYMGAVVRYRIFRRPIRSFEDYIVAHFGRRLGEFNMLNYTEKIWGIPCSRLHPDWARQRIKGLNLTTAARNALFGKKGTDAPKTLIDTFYYPQFGTGLIYETIAKRITASGSRLWLESSPTRITHDGKRITGVAIRRDGEEVVLRPKRIASSIPITAFLDMLSPAPPKAVRDAAKRLRWRAQVYVFLTIDKDRITKDNWIYFPDRSMPIGRISEMRNFSRDMSPKGKTSIMVEFFVDEGDAIWKMPDEEVKELAISNLERIGLLERKRVRKGYVLRRSHVYPVYDLTYERNLTTIKRYLDGFKNLQYIGRPGRFRYNNQDHSLEMGILAARGILEGKRYDFDRIGAENEYFESGSLPTEEKDKAAVSENGSLPAAVLPIPSRLPEYFVGYLLFAGIATLVDVGSLYALTEFAGIHYFTSAAVAYLAGMATNFSLNKWFNFRNRSRRVVAQFSLFALVAGIGLLLNQAIIYGLVEYAGIQYLIAKVVSVAVVMFWSFFGHKHLTFKLFQ